MDYVPQMGMKGLREVLRPTPEEEKRVPRPCLSLRKTQTLGKTLVRAKLKNMEEPPQSMTPIVIPTTPDTGNHSASLSAGLAFGTAQHLPSPSTPPFVCLLARLLITRAACN